MSMSDIMALAQGAVATVLLSLAGIAVGVPAGLVFALIRWAKIPILAQIVAAYVSVIRATPLVTLVLLIFFALPGIGIPVDPIPAAIISLSLNTAAFNCEIWRSALNDFPKAQVEAAEATGMSPVVAFRYIIFPQIWRISLPALVNEITLLIKNSPAVAIVGVVDITRAAVRIGAQTYDPLPPFLIATVMYAVIVFVFVKAQASIETAMTRKFDF
ncbi:MAG: amino acid ABC transporter permease [Beijerinckiaceae bacterium]|nr:amino acid ABC transporter permease [Beijerinckiaceae bacterium]